jgi:hypothetical protein
MKLLPALSFFLLACSARAFDIEALFDRLDNALTVSAFQNNLRARLSGTLDLEFYHFQQPPPGLINSKIDNLFEPRLTLFLDAQITPYVYVFFQTRVDRHFDPSDQGAQIRLDEYAARITPWEDGRLNLQIGTFATVVGNWVPRHLSWENPFINAPLVYESVTALEDRTGRFSRHFERDLPREKYEFIPVIWGPVYATGVSVSGRLGQFDYAAEMKNTSLSSRPETWHVTTTGFEHPTFSGRVGYRPNVAWNFGLSASEGAYLRPVAEPMLPRGRDIGDYREYVLGQDISYAVRHLQLWAEFYEARFEVPRAGDADTFAYYVEAKYKFTPQFFGAIRWNQQLFGKIDISRGESVPLGEDLGRIDVAATYRFTAHTQLKAQYSFQKQTSASGDDNHLFAAQFTVRF